MLIRLEDRISGRVRIQRAESVPLPSEATRRPEVDPRLRTADLSERLGCLNVAGIEE
jgi:hypothetical protein